MIGGFFLLFIGYKIFKTKVDLEHLEDKSHLSEKILENEKKRTKDKGGFRTGFMISFLNPTLFLSWMTSSFFVITLVTSWGFNTGGLDESITANYKSINKIEKVNPSTIHAIAQHSIDSLNALKQEQSQTISSVLPSYFPLLLSLCYAFCIALGSIIWFYYLAIFLAKFRQRINVKIINRIISGLGLILCLFGLFLGYKAIIMFI